MAGDYTRRQGQFLAFIILLHQSERAPTRRGRHAAILSGFAPVGASDGRDIGKAGIHRAGAGAGAFNTSPASS